MRPETQQRVFAEVFRVLTPGGRWIIWDAAIPVALENDTRGPIFRFRFHLPGKVVQTGYGTFWPEKPMDLNYYKGLARAAGFQIDKADQQSAVVQTVKLELRKPK